MNKNISHKKYLDLLLKKHIYKNIAKKENQELKIHLKKCSQCKEKEKSILAKRKILNKMPKLKPHKALEKNIIESVQTKTPLKLSINFTDKIFGYTNRLRIAAAAIPLLLTSVFLFRNFMNNKIISSNRLELHESKAIGKKIKKTPTENKILNRINNYLLMKKINTKTLDTKINIKKNIKIFKKRYKKPSVSKHENNNIIDKKEKMKSIKTKDLYKNNEINIKKDSNKKKTYLSYDKENGQDLGASKQLERSMTKRTKISRKKRKPKLPKRIELKKNKLIKKIKKPKRIITYKALITFNLRDIQKKKILKHVNNLKNTIAKVLPKNSRIHFLYKKQKSYKPIDNRANVYLLLFILIELTIRIATLIDIKNNKNPRKKQLYILSIILGSLFLPFYIFIRKR